MDRASLNDDPEILLDQTAWVSGLARSLAVDASGAEDVAQEALLAALQSQHHSPGDAARLRAWLAKVVANLSNLRVRRESRRRVREEWVARPEPVPSVADTVSRAGQLRLVVDEVMDLGEPYRSTVLLRYFDGLPTRQIAESMECSPEAVRKRLSRALRMLRERLDRKHGGDGATWLAALAPLIGELPSPPSLAGFARRASDKVPGPGLGLGSSGWSIAASFGAVLVVGAGVAGGRALLSPAPAEAAVSSGTLMVVDESLEGDALSGTRVSLSSGEFGGDSSTLEGQLEPPGRIDQRFVIDESHTPPSVRPAPALSGHVFDLEARPVSGLEIATAAHPDQVLTRSYESGAFDLHLEQPEARLLARSEDYATLRAARVDDLALVARPVIVVGRSVDLSGHVVDESGVPLADARIALVESELALHGFPWPLQDTVSIDRNARTSADGRFDLEDWVSGASLTLRFELDGYQGISMPVPALSERGLVITLIQEPLRALHGVVLHADGAPAPGARVQLEDYMARADAQGLFRLEHRRVRPEATLLAVSKGFAPGQVSSFGVRLLDADSPAAVRIVLGGPTYSIAGHVRDRSGRPVEGWDTFAVSVGADSPVAEVSLAAATSASWSVTAADGGFLLTGLVDADYIVHAVNRDSLLVLSSGVVRPGAPAPVELEIPQEPFRVVEGRVVAPDGAPFVDARVTVVLECSALGCQDDLLLGQSVRTDASGHFCLPDVPASFVDLRVEHAEVSGVLLDLAPAADLTDLEIRVPRDRLIQVFDDTGGVRTIGFVGLDGQPLEFLGSRGERRQRTTTRGGQSSVLQVTEDASELVVFEDHVEVQRVPLLTQEGQISRMRVVSPAPVAPTLP